MYKYVSIATAGGVVKVSEKKDKYGMIVAKCFGVKKASSCRLRSECYLGTTFLTSFDLFLLILHVYVFSVLS